MKKPLILSYVLFLCIYCANVNAQSPKTGHLSVERVMMFMPELPVVRSEMQDFQTKINSQVQVKYEVLQSKIAEYEKMIGGLDQESKRTREKDIQNLDRDLQKYRQDAQQAATTKENKLLEPVYNRVQEAIDAVAKKKGYEQVFRADTLLYTANSEDIFEMVMKELGIELPEEGNS